MLFLGKPRQNESDLSKPAGIRKPNLGLQSHTVSGQKRKDLSPVNPGYNHYYFSTAFFKLSKLIKLKTIMFDLVSSLTVEI